ncbi:hypothetical protein [Arsenicibacter rosenii]|uniref:Uncharacterized protein n=1 Tax=Arsenicibacter rosenii TaxID=1750698 RepID=A0A1S2VJD3_9BACT|nr:hypothetical protein [Arsenicibacter rosenii]OIN58859.1 hypothetical protein BLX24_11550 [Arsenicibacter rosenii]
MSVTEAFGDIASLIAQMAPEKVINLKASSTMSAQVEALISKKKEGSITPDESAELERFLGLDIFISLAKARARLILHQ